MEYAQFIQQTLEDPEYNVFDQQMKDKIMSQFNDCFEFNEDVVVIKPTLLSKALQLLKKVYTSNQPPKTIKRENNQETLIQNEQTTENQANQNSERHNTSQPENTEESPYLLLKTLGESLGIKYSPDSGQQTVFQLAYLFSEQKKRIKDLESQIEAQKNSTLKIKALYRYIKSLERVNEQQNAMLVTYEAENQKLRNETKYAIEAIFSGFSGEQYDNINPEVNKVTTNIPKQATSVPTSSPKDGKKKRALQQRAAHKPSVERAGSCPGSFGSSTNQQDSSVQFELKEARNDKSIPDMPPKKTSTKQQLYKDKNNKLSSIPEIPEIMQELHEKYQILQQVTNFDGIVAIERQAVQQFTGTSIDQPPSSQVLNDIELFSVTDTNNNSSEVEK